MSDQKKDAVAYVTKKWPKSWFACLQMIQ